MLKTPKGLCLLLILNSPYLIVRIELFIQLAQFFIRRPVSFTVLLFSTCQPYFTLFRQKALPKYRAKVLTLGPGLIKYAVPFSYLIFLCTLLCKYTLSFGYPAGCANVDRWDVWLYLLKVTRKALYVLYGIINNTYDNIIYFCENISYLIAYFLYTKDQAVVSSICLLKYITMTHASWNKLMAR